jgi:hypothetical protein
MQKSETNIHNQENRQSGAWSAAGLSTRGWHPLLAKDPQTGIGKNSPPYTYQKPEV